MNGELAVQYYRLALSAAARRDLSSAALYARSACLLGGGQENAARLLGLCLYERGELAEAQNVLSSFPELAATIREECGAMENGFERIGSLVRQKKWRGAMRGARLIPHQSVRILNIQGCLCALAGDNGKAARFFAKALQKDCGDRLALAGLMEAVNRKKRLWGSK